MTRLIELNRAASRSAACMCCESTKDVRALTFGWPDGNNWTVIHLCSSCREKAAEALTEKARGPSPPPDPREEAFWSAAFCAALTSEMRLNPDETIGDRHLFEAVTARNTASIADAALAEWRKRFAAKEEK